MNHEGIEKLLAELYEADPSLRAKEGVLRPLILELMEARPDVRMNAAARAALKSRLLQHAAASRVSLWSRVSSRAYYPLVGAVALVLLFVAVQRGPSFPVALEGVRDMDAPSVAMAPPSAPQGAEMALKSAADSSFAVTQDMRLSSPAFVDGGPIPSEYVCSNNGMYAPLTFENVPEGAASLAVIVEDPDAQGDGAVLLVLYNIDPTVPGAVWYDPPKGSVVGTNDVGGRDYSSPCPSPGSYRYIYTLYALDTTFSETSAYNGAELLDAMRNHIVAQTAISGTYETR